MKPEQSAGDGPNRYEDRAEFERQLEARYNFPGPEFLSVLGFVDSEREWLVPAFWSWKQVGRHDGRLSDLLRTWERQRFGAELYESAHQVLLFAVMESLTNEQRPSRYGRIQPNRTNQERKESLNAALDAITRARSMPEPLLVVKPELSEVHELAE